MRADIASIVCRCISATVIVGSGSVLGVALGGATGRQVRQQGPISVSYCWWDSGPLAASETATSSSARATSTSLHRSQEWRGKPPDLSVGRDSATLHVSLIGNVLLNDF